MAPLSHFHYLVSKQVLFCCFFLSLLFVSSFCFSVDSLSDEAQSGVTDQPPQIPFARSRTLLGTKPLLENDEDEDDNQKLSALNKQKNKFFDDDDDGVFSKKKKKSSFDNEEEEEDDDDAALLYKEKKKKKSSSSISDEIKLVKPKPTFPKNQTKMIIKHISSSGSSKNKTKLTKTTPTTKDADEDSIPNISKPKKINSTSKPFDSTKSSDSSSSTKKSSLDLLKTTKLVKSETRTPKKKQQIQKQKYPPSWLYQDDDEDDDLVSEFRDLPAKFQETFVPDLHRISTTSRNYLSKANKEITKGFKPYVGKKYAPSAATAISFAAIIVPLIIVSFLFRRIKTHFSLQRLLIFIQIYLTIYFFILCISSLITGLEPLRFLYATSQSTYVWVHLLQTFGYLLYLLLLLIYLVLVFSTDSGPVHKLLGLAQTFAGFAVGLHYYMTVVHRVVLCQPPKTSWKVHGFYATCFFVTCLSARVDRRKKAYFGEEGQQGKKN